MEEILETGKSKQESIEIVPMEREATANFVMLGTERRNKILRNKMYLPSRKERLSLQCPALTQCLHLAATQYTDVLCINECIESES